MCVCVKERERKREIEGSIRCWDVSCKMLLSETCLAINDASTYRNHGDCPLLICLLARLIMQAFICTCMCVSGGGHSRRLCRHNWNHG